MSTGDASDKALFHHHFSSPSIITSIHHHFLHNWGQQK